MKIPDTGCPSFALMGALTLLSALVVAQHVPFVGGRIWSRRGRNPGPLGVGTTTLHNMFAAGDVARLLIAS
jgi:hypothetical protein